MHISQSTFSELPVHLAVKWVVLVLLLILLIGFTMPTVGAVPDTGNVLILSDPKARHDVNSAPQASGLYACPQGLSPDAVVKPQRMAMLDRIDPHSLQTTTLPDFQKNHRYCMFIAFRNETDQYQWKLHFSNFFLQKVKLILWDGTSLQAYQSDWASGVDTESINVLGRAFSLKLEQNKDYFMVVELTARGLVAAPYVALMTKHQYQTWSAAMSNLYSVSTGVVMGLVLMALLCSVILKDITFFWFGISSLFLFSIFAMRSHLGLFVLHGDEYLPPWIWLWATLALLSFMLFARSFLLPEPEDRPIKKIFNLSIVIFLFSLLLSHFLPRQWSVAMYLLDSIIMMVLIFSAGIVRVIEKGRYYLIFMLGWVPVLFSLVELVGTVTIEPEPGVSTLSYKILREPFYQIIHMLIHFVAMLIRIDTLKKEKHQAEMKNEAKSRFLASVSHDLRQPLHSMGMFLAHLNDYVSSSAGQNVLTKVYGLHTAMNDSFKKLMDLSRLEAGAVKLNNEQVDLRLLIARMQLEFEPYACAKGLKIRFRSNIKKLDADPELLERILRNLLSNAIKYTEEGGVLVGFRRRRDHLLIQVWDTGCGISADDQCMIFDIYERSEKVSASHKGMGIGLAIVRHLVDLLGGEILVRSTESNTRAKTGTLFQVKLPYTDVSHQETESKAKTGLRIIVDLPDAPMLSKVSGSLKSWGYLTTDESSEGGSVPITLIIMACADQLTAESMTECVSHLEEQYGNVVIGLFCDNVDRELAGKLTALNVHILSAHYRPAQLRSLLRYLESFLLKKQP